MSSLVTSTSSDDSNNNLPTLSTISSSQENAVLNDAEMSINRSTDTKPTSKTAKTMKKQFKKLKDPEAPRRPLSPFMLFVREERAKVVMDMGNSKAIGDVGKELGRRWGLIDQEGKKKYEEAFREDKARYEEEMKTYQPSNEFLERKAKHDMVLKGGNKESDTDMEKYFFFLQSNWRKISSENPGLNSKEVQEIAWTQWSQGYKILGVKSKKVKRSVDPEAPRKPLTAFFLFQKKMRKGGLASNVKGLAEMWKNMEEGGRKSYKEEEMELKKKYLEEMLLYKKKNMVNQTVNMCEEPV